MEPSREPSDVVCVDDATVTLGSNVILGPVSLRVRAGESWAILGPNGSGKSTLLDLAGGIRHPTSGAVAILGGRLGSVDVREIRARIGFVGHHVAEAIPPSLPVRDVVLTGKRSTLVPWMQTFDDDDRRLADDLLRRVRCEGLSRRPLETCSQGERQRVMLARALFGRPELLLLDEPTAGLDLPGRELLLGSTLVRHGDATDDDPRHPSRRGDPPDDHACGAPATRAARRVGRHRRRAHRRERHGVLRPADLGLGA